MKRLLISLAIAMAPFIAATARADRPAARSATKHSSPLAQSLAGSAKESFDAAQVLVNNGDYAGAYAKFGQAYEISKDPRLLFNMAVCARNLHEYARMQGLLARYRDDARDSMSADDKASVENALATIRTLVGSIRLSVSESDAAVAIDGEGVGSTPIAQPIVIDLGKHTLSVKKDGFIPVDRALVIVGGTETPLAVTLMVQRHVGRLIVVADDAATVTVDGQSVAKGRFDAELPTGAHQVQVMAEGKRPFQSQIELRDDETRSLDVTLDNDKHGAPLWPWLVGGAAVAVGAAVGGYFLFQPQDQTTPVPPGKTGSFQLQSRRR